MQAGSNIKLDASKTRIYKPEHDEFYNQRESYLSESEKRIYEQPLKHFDKTLHALYADRHNDGTQVRLGSPLRESDHYSRLRKTQELKDDIQTSTIIRSSPQVIRYQSPGKALQEPNRFLSSTQHKTQSIVESVKRSPVREHHYSRTEVISGPQRVDRVNTSPFDPTLTQYMVHGESPQVIHQHRTIHQTALDRSPKSSAFDARLPAHNFERRRQNVVESSAKKSPTQENIEFEYKHKFASGSTLVQASPNTKTVIEETKEYDNGQSLIQRTIFENGVEIDSETISPVKEQIVERQPSRTESAYLRSPVKSTNSRSQYHLEARAEERSSPFRYSPVRREPSNYKLTNQQEYFEGEDRQ